MKSQQMIHSEQIRVRWIDTDASKRIHYTAIFKYFEILEQEFFRSNGLTYSTLESLGISLPRVNVQCNYQSMIQLDDLLNILVVIERIGHSSVTLQYQVTQENGVEAAHGSVTFVSVNTETGKRTQLPKPLLDCLNNSR